mmetsp:Transcript_12867/g.26092  ORF Transcript_12867/g.26092 Transcript_12867/m.26092 type:complete len:109 (-) Transcript_12867:954-1280(-)
MRHGASHNRHSHAMMEFRMHYCFHGWDLDGRQIPSEDGSDQWKMQGVLSGVEVQEVRQTRQKSHRVKVSQDRTARGRWPPVTNDVAVRQKHQILERNSRDLDEAIDTG